ncbi:MAG: AI-2E family transporter [Lachnospiraceae bacterium]|nr:AI-2E family transporter [Lachnospiraceae bacterium]
MRFDSAKLVSLIIGLASYIVVYLAVKYALPLFIPFVAAYVLAWCIRPVAKIFSDRFRMNSGMAAFMALFLTVVLVVSFLCWTGINAAGQVCGLIKMWNRCSGDMVNEMKHTCSYIEDSIGLKDGTIYRGVVRYADGFNTNNITSKVMGSSVSAAVTSVECIVAAFVVIISAFYFLKDRDKMAEKRAGSLFGKEINRIMGRIYTTGVAYAKAQAVIMIITAVVCFIGFKMAGIKYSALYAVVVGILDALPLLGIGVFLLPAAAIYALRRQLRTAVIMVVVFIICYCTREILEPRIMGKNVGLSPIMTMITMYVGYKLFGLTGVITGPFSYIAANELANILIKGTGEVYDEEIEDSKT